MSGPMDMPPKARSTTSTLTNIGLGLCLAGVFMLGYAANRTGGANTPLGWAGLGVIAFGWVLFGYVIYLRTRYVRPHQSKG